MNRYDLQNQTIQKWISEKSPQLKNQFEKVLKNIEDISNKSINLKELRDFVLYSQNFQDSKLASFVERLTIEYNTICERLIKLIKEANPKSSLLKSRLNKINPFSIKSDTPLLALPY